MKNIQQNIAAWNWPAITETLHAQGFAQTPRLFDDAMCAALKKTFDEEHLFRKRVVMEKHDYGRGVYGYYDRPLPQPIAHLRQALYPPLAEVANTWQERLGLDPNYPPALNTYLAQCHAVGQTKPTPLMLRYGAGDFNRLHRDLYGEKQFPLQVVFLLDEPGLDYQGGELVLVAQKPRSQSRAHVVPLTKGAGVIFAVHQFPGIGKRGYRRLALSHGVSTIHSGTRTTLGIIFHDAKS